MFLASYSRPRFRYLDRELRRTLGVRWQGDSSIRKTGCFYGPDFNWYIDTSDGINEDVLILEYTGRMRRVIEDAAGKPFLFFKCIASPERTRPLVELAERHNGQVIPFMQWPHNREWFGQRRLRRRLAAQRRQTVKQHAVGMAASLTPYQYPQPDQAEPTVSWKDRHNFGIGAGVDTGSFTIDTRRNLHEQLRASSLDYYHTEKTPYRQYLQASLNWQAVLCPPGMGEYTQRIFDHGFTGQCMILRKSSYDFGLSWKPWLPEINFMSKDWQQHLQTVVDDFKLWEEKALQYFTQALTPGALVAFLQEKLAQSSRGTSRVDGALALPEAKEEQL